MIEEIAGKIRIFNSRIQEINSDPSNPEYSNRVASIRNKINKEIFNIVDKERLGVK